VYRNAAPERIRVEIEDSLRRLRTSYIDIYQVHWPDPLVPRWVLDQGPTIALWGARGPGQLSPLKEIVGWHLDDDTRILAETITDPVGPEFMAPPVRETSARARGRRSTAPATT
jgi:aryl-alcohol dehydrogenase-like predicted oxidoreductase